MFALNVAIKSVSGAWWYLNHDLADGRPSAEGREGELAELQQALDHLIAAQEIVEKYKIS